ncbi:peptide-methionine (R)-S-oxide reductase [Candidatus Curtissbacteria bacterium]|nr:peptide-methionine (R)-S-oxide reductase [Candidatus Curtissbacteria bacterium]
MDKKKLERRKSKLASEQYNICFLRGTEPPFSGKYTHNKQVGTYYCVVCASPLFSSATKFDSGTGWPSFDRVLENKYIKTEKLMDQWV